MVSTIQDARAIGEPLRVFDFRMIISPLRGTNGATPQTVSLRCQSTVIPEIQNSPTMVEVQSYRLPRPGRALFTNQWQCRFVEYTDLAILQQIDTWARLCTDPITQKIANFQDIQSNATIELLNGQQETVITRTLVGVWPAMSPGFPLDTRSSDQVSFDTTWFFDYVS
jgi:hypothetical protein